MFVIIFLWNLDLVLKNSLVIFWGVGGGGGGGDHVWDSQGLALPTVSLPAVPET